MTPDQSKGRKYCKTEVNKTENKKRIENISGDKRWYFNLKIKSVMLTNF